MNLSQSTAPQCGGRPKIEGGAVAQQQLVRSVIEALGPLSRFLPDTIKIETVRTLKHSGSGNQAAPAELVDHGKKVRFKIPNPPAGNPEFEQRALTALVAFTLPSAVAELAERAGRADGVNLTTELTPLQLLANKVVPNLSREATQQRSLADLAVLLNPKISVQITDDIEAFVKSYGGTAPGCNFLGFISCLLWTGLNVESVREVRGSSSGRLQ